MIYLTDFVLFRIICIEITHFDQMFDPLNFPVAFLLNLIIYLFNLSLVIFSLTYYAIILINTAALFIILQAAFLMRIRRNLISLNQFNSSQKLGEISRFSWIPIHQFIQYDIETFGYLFVANSLYGRLFGAFVCVGVPISAFCIVGIALGAPPTTETAIIVSMIPAHQIMCCIFMHLLTAILTVRLHCSTRQLFRLNVVTGYRIANLRARIKLALTIARLRTTARYGFTYGAFGLVTMVSFGKVCIEFAIFFIRAKCKNSFVFSV